MEGGGYFTDLMNDGNYDLPLDDLSSPALDDLSSPIEEQSSPIPDSTPLARPNQKRSNNFSEEDTVLVSAWLKISMDLLHGINQSRGSFWKRIHDYFHNHKDFVSNRSQSSLQHRWSAIQESVNQFCGCLSQIEGERIEAMGN
uniref:Uncharacterized protein n=1 Tax=Arundo donax TaxID=35708 RepID=A0A0A9MZC1_ARUDO